MWKSDLKVFFSKFGESLTLPRNKKAAQEAIHKTKSKIFANLNKFWFLLKRSSRIKIIDHKFFAFSHLSI